jgi:uncharacterized protein YjdB
MKKIKRIISLFLVACMVCGLAVTTTAANEDVTLAAYKEDGSSLTENVSVGDKITIKMFVNKNASAFSASFRIWYDSSAFTFDSANSSFSTTVATAFASEKKITGATTVNNATTEEQAKLDAGFLPVNLVVAAGSDDVALPQGEWVSLSFTAAEATDNAQFLVQIRAIDSATAGGDVSDGWTEGSTSVTIKEAVIHVESITLSQTTATANMEKPFTLVATVNPQNATYTTVTWSSDDESVATVDSNGLVTPVSAGGPVNITATVDGCSASCAVTITNKLNSVSFSPNKATVIAGEKYTFAPVIKPAHPDGLTLSWTSANTSIAEVDAETGEITPLAPGNVKLTVEATDAFGTTKKGSITLTVIAAPNGNGVYTVTMPADTSAFQGESVSLPVVIGTNDEEVSTFNAVDMIFSYDADALSLKTATIDGFEVTNGNGTVRVQGYGADRSLGTAFTLQFDVTAAGETTVTCTQAKVDISVNAITENVANAEIIDPDTLITVTKMCNITLPDGMSSEQGASVTAGTDYTFKVDSYDENYIYTVTATAGDDTVAVTDSGNGTYEIKNVQNNITVSMSKEGKPVSVTVTGDDVTGVTTATYGTDYTFTVQKEEGFAYTVTVTIGGVEHSLAAPDDDGTYTIPGADITGDVVITVNKTMVEESVGVMYEGNGADDVQNAVSTAVKGEDFVFVLNKADGYDYTVKYLVGAVGEPVELTVAEDGSYTISGDKITDDVLITITKVKVYTVAFVGNGAGRVQNNPPATVEEGSDYNFTVYQHAIYNWTVTAAINATEVAALEPLNDYPTDNNTGNINYKVQNVTGDLVISINYAVDTSKINIEIVPYVETEASTVFLVMIQPKTDELIRLDAYDGERFYQDRNNKYTSYFTEKYNCSNRVYMFLKFVEQGETLTVEDLLPKLSFVSSTLQITKTDDINVSQFVDINDAQLVYDIYNGKYIDFTAVSMQKFLNADVNCDMKVDVQDSAAVVNAIP